MLQRLCDLFSRKRENRRMKLGFPAEENSWILYRRLLRRPRLSFENICI